MLDLLIGRVLGGGGGNDNNNGILGGLFGETREAVLGGCWGLIMSSVFFFFFFVTGMAMFFGISTLPEEYKNIINANAFIFIFMLCISGFASPIVGILFGLQSGFYSVGRHIAVFMLYLLVLLAAIMGISYFGFVI